MTSAEENNNKLRIDIYVPLDACACMYETFINQVFKVLIEYIRQIDFETKSINSEEARRLKINQNAVVIDGEKIIYSAFKLKKELPRLLKEKGILA
ncbi:MAG: hypothetical protein ACXQS8_02890 [Candidatus Helarchaeales archaeon]